MTKDERKEYLRRKQAERRAKLKEVAVEAAEGEWDAKKYPERAAWEIAVERARRAREYARKMPEHVRPSEEIFQEVEWQYWNEGIPAVRKQVFT